MQWSKLRSKIRDFITPELRKRIDIHETCYHDAYDNYGEVWITLDGKKIFGGGYYHWYLTQKPAELLTEFEIQHGYHKDFYQAKIESGSVEELMKLGVHDTCQITKSLENYLNTDYEECLTSNNPIYKSFAFIDRRLGKRRFEKIVLEEKEHILVERFYSLRYECFHSNEGAPSVDAL